VIDANRGDHFLQADFSLLIRSTSSTPFVDDFLFADNPGAISRAGSNRDANRGHF
jgi:hypothetical protein